MGSGIYLFLVILLDSGEVIEFRYDDDANSGDDFVDFLAGRLEMITGWRQELMDCPDLRKRT